MTIERSHQKPEPLSAELEQAVAGLRAFVEPTPAQLELSYQRVEQALAGLAPGALPPAPPAVLPTPVLPAPVLPAPVLPAPVLPAPLLPQAAVSVGRALRARRVLWAVSGGVTVVALVAGFAIGRWTGTAPVGVAASAASPALLAPPPALPSSVPSTLEAGSSASVSSETAATAPAEPAPELPASDERAPRSSEGNPPRAAQLKTSPAARRAANASEQLCPARDPLLRAECLLRRQQPERALAALRTAPAKQERERERVLGLTLLARCQLGGEVRKLGERFFAQWPASPLTWRIRNECPRAEPGVDGSLQRAEVSPVLTR